MSEHLLLRSTSEHFFHEVLWLQQSALAKEFGFGRETELKGSLLRAGRVKEGCSSVAIGTHLRNTHNAAATCLLDISEALTLTAAKHALRITDPASGEDTLGLFNGQNRHGANCYNCVPGAAFPEFSRRAGACADSEISRKCSLCVLRFAEE